MTIVGATDTCPGNNQTALDWNAMGLPGTNGAIGLTGPAGADGLPGPQGSPGISGYLRISQAASQSGPFWEADVTCPGGRKVLSGGFHTGGAADGDVSTITNAPSGTTGGGDVIWQVRLFDPNGSLTEVFADVICANVAP